jgi:tripartite-type tricarboxylate transporter receptor subunit TctC
MKRTITRLVTLGLLSALGAGQALAQASQAQSYPSKPIRMIVPFPAGGPSDVVARIIGQKMTENWGQQVIVDNRPGANTIIGAEAVARAAPDGYTLLVPIDSTLSMNQFLYSKLPYDPLKDFAPISLLMWSPIIMVTDAAAGPKTVQELLQQAKANPGKLNFGAGTILTQLTGELIKNQAGVNFVYVPYKGSPGTVQGLLSNDVTFILDGVTSSVPHIKSGKFRVLANMSSQPISALPNLPSFATEANLPGFDVSVWLGLAAPAGTPPEIVNKLSQEIARIYTLPDAREKVAATGNIPASNSPGEFAAFIRAQATRWAPVIKQSGIKLD